MFFKNNVIQWAMIFRLKTKPIQKEYTLLIDMIS